MKPPASIPAPRREPRIFARLREILPQLRAEPILAAEMADEVDAFFVRNPSLLRTTTAEALATVVTFERLIAAHAEQDQAKNQSHEH